MRKCARVFSDADAVGSLRGSDSVRQIGRRKTSRVPHQESLFQYRQPNAWVALGGWVLRIAFVTVCGMPVVTTS